MGEAGRADGNAGATKSTARGKVLSSLAEQACPCGRQGRGGKAKALPYAQCCGLYLDGDATAPNAESLMRSRYTAFVLQRGPYLLRTWAPSKRPTSIEFEPGVKWLGLEVRRARVVDAQHAEVEFVARQKPAQGAAVRLHERSRFVLEDGQWLYVDGDLL